MPFFEQSDFTDRAETVVGCTLSVEAFHPSMVTSIQHGAEAIDISETHDIFGICRSPEDSFLFIGHDFIIYLLKQALREEDAFRRFSRILSEETNREYALWRSGKMDRTVFSVFRKREPVRCRIIQKGPYEVDSMRG